MKPPKGYTCYGPHEWKYGAILWQKKMGRELYLNLWQYHSLPGYVGERWEADAQIRDTRVGTVDVVFLEPEGRVKEIERVVRGMVGWLGEEGA